MEYVVEVDGKEEGRFSGGAGMIAIPGGGRVTWNSYAEAGSLAFEWGKNERGVDYYLTMPYCLGVTGTFSVRLVREGGFYESLFTG